MHIHIYIYIYTTIPEADTPAERPRPTNEKAHVAINVGKEVRWFQYAGAAKVCADWRNCVYIHSSSLL